MNVLYGSATGLEPSADIFIQGSGGVQGTAETDDNFGAAVTEGNFNGDEFFDLAVGAPSEAVGSDAGAGAVNVLYGSAAGLGGGPLFVQSNPEVGDGFGASLATADFDGNGFFDLAVGAPQERVGAEQSAGLVSVFYASGGGVFGASESFTQDSPGLGGSSEAFDFFGAALE